MSVEQDIAGGERGRIVRVEEMPVRRKQRPSARKQKGVIGEEREREHHLVHFRVAVAAHAENARFQRIEELRHPLGE